MILLVNGPNLNLLGEREPHLEGRATLADVERQVAATCAAYGLCVKAFQSNSEGALLDFLQEHRRAAQGVILNPGALGQTSLALHDCVEALPCPCIEVHLANVHARGPGRRESVTAPAALGQISGLGTSGYYYAALHLCARVAEEAEAAGARATGRPAAAAVVAPPVAAPVQRPRAPVPPEPRRAPPAAQAGPRAPDDSEDIPVDVNARGDYEP